MEQFPDFPKGNKRIIACGNVEGMKFVIMQALGYPKGDQLRQTTKGFKRKSMDQITDRADSRLEPARIWRYRKCNTNS